RSAAPSGWIAQARTPVHRGCRFEILLRHNSTRQASRRGTQVRRRQTCAGVSRTRAETERALQMLQAWTTERGLTLHPTKTKIVDAETEGFEFLGYRFVKHR